MTADPKQESVEDVLARIGKRYFKRGCDCRECVDGEKDFSDLAAALERRNAAILEVAEEMEDLEKRQHYGCTCGLMGKGHGGWLTGRAAWLRAIVEGE